MKQTTQTTATASSSSQALASTSSTTLETLKLAPAPATSQTKTKLKSSHKIMTEDDFAQPSQLVQTQMAARVNAQIQNSKATIPSESIELPEISSEYSDSEDEGRARTFDPPNWAQSPELKHALEQQATINPDHIFGDVPTLRIEEIFKNRSSRFRARTSSANWTGTDRLTREEEVEYARRMGFR